MDILLSSNLERLLFEASRRKPAEIYGIGRRKPYALFRKLSRFLSA